MSALKQPALQIEFRGDRARFQSPAHQERVDEILRKADSLAEKAVVERARLQVRARL